MDQGTLRSALEWQIELGATEAIGDQPVDRFSLPDKAPWLEKARAPAPEQTALPHRASVIDPVDVAETLAAGAQSLEALEQALRGYEHCELKRGARNTVFADGLAGARVMLVGEAPGRDEDVAGKPFVGRAGHLLDRMFGAIGLNRNAPDPAKAFYVTNVLPWRPPQNRDPQPEEIAMMQPFLRRHIELAAPDILVLIGNHACQALLGKRGILKLRGHWQDVGGRPALPMTHPAYLLRNAAQKGEAWANLLSLQARLRDT